MPLKTETRERESVCVCVCVCVSVEWKKVEREKSETQKPPIAKQNINAVRVRVFAKKKRKRAHTNTNGQFFSPIRSGTLIVHTFNNSPSLRLAFFFCSIPVQFGSTARAKWSGTVGSVKALSPIRLRNGPLREPKPVPKVCLFSTVSTFEILFFLLFGL